VTGASAAWLGERDDEIGFVGSPVTLYRTTEARYADQARLDWNAYASATLAGSQGAGGRFNPKGEFGAVYTADDEATAWEEAGSRFTREGVRGLPATMQLLTIVVVTGRYADFRIRSVCDDFEVTPEALSTETPTEDDKESCWRVARAVRALADFLASPSARGPGSNIPLYSDRPDSELRATFAGALAGRVPAHLVQSASESW
jgi:RES domain-containing protein